MLILEIILTIVAWNRGWKWLSLIPLAIPVGVGLIVGASGMSMSDIESLWWIDLLAIIALIIMIAAKKKPEKEEVKTPVEKPKDGNLTT